MTVLHFQPAPSWQRDAACKECDDPAIFFPEHGGTATAAVEVCSRCPVRVECLAWAIAEGIDHGVFGGVSARARVRMRDSGGGVR